METWDQKVLNQVFDLIYETKCHNPRSLEIPLSAPQLSCDWLTCLCKHLGDTCRERDVNMRMLHGRCNNDYLLPSYYYASVWSRFHFLCTLNMPIDTLTQKTPPTTQRFLVMSVGVFDQQKKSQTLNIQYLGLKIHPKWSQFNQAVAEQGSVHSCAASCNELLE